MARLTMKIATFYLLMLFSVSAFALPEGSASVHCPAQCGTGEDQWFVNNSDAIVGQNGVETIDQSPLVNNLATAAYWVRTSVCSGQVLYPGSTQAVGVVLRRNDGAFLANRTVFKGCFDPEDTEEPPTQCVQGRDVRFRTSRGPRELSACFAGCSYNGELLLYSDYSPYHEIRYTETAFQCVAGSGTLSNPEDPDCPAGSCADATPPSVPPGGCIEAADGSVYCSLDSDPSERPDTGTPGQPATPGGTVTANPPTLGLPSGSPPQQYYYYPPTVVSGSTNYGGATTGATTGGTTGTTTGTTGGTTGTTGGTTGGSSGGTTSGQTGGGGTGGDQTGTVSGRGFNAPTFAESNSALLARVKGSPLFTALSSVGGMAPSGGSCPTASFRVLEHDFVIDAHCDLIEMNRDKLRALFLFIFTLAAVLIAFR